MPQVLHRTFTLRTHTARNKPLPAPFSFLKEEEAMSLQALIREMKAVLLQAKKEILQPRAESVDRLMKAVYG